MLSVRPKVAELVFQLYGRALHPELFEVCSTTSIERDAYQVKIDITRTGHVVTWRRQGMTLTEVTTSAHHPLPERRRLMNYKLKGQRNDRMECRGGIAYQMSFQLEPYEPAQFWTLQDELCRDGERRGLLQQFGSSGRMALGALSYISYDTRARSLLIQAVHTFPDDYAIVKTQSHFVLP